MNWLDVHDRASLALFVRHLRRELNDPMALEKWENVELGGFLDALAAWAVDGDGPADANPWRHVAKALTAASAYE
ncbi:DUF7660 family protein [Antarcticirhabdus aurantiaca]|uniref:Uncharacterized protein n=1 Tax=Antarcticirhabdus aurantiaca TaxID=2606717 RepID=A0ACD4NUY2_9HYPH|nr:hypothetical protein [Antarcticirhabdus aurantiaca]WAJ30564.1 hypothetical protein OXU80_10305 [Jeongeuplla avenae]